MTNKNHYLVSENEASALELSKAKSTIEIASKECDGMRTEFSRGLAHEHEKKARSFQSGSSEDDSNEFSTLRRELYDLRGQLHKLHARGGTDCYSPDSEKKKLQDALRSVVVTQKPNVKWDDVAGLDEAKTILKEVSILSYLFTTKPNYFVVSARVQAEFLFCFLPGNSFTNKMSPVIYRQTSSLQWNSLLWTSWNWCVLTVDLSRNDIGIKGKTELARAVATETDCPFFSVSSSDLVSSFQGESERLISNLFEMARKAAKESPSSRAIVFIDEADSLCSRRKNNDSDSETRIKTELMKQMDGLGKENSEVLVLGATNAPWQIDDAMRRRFQNRLYIPLPDEDALVSIIKIHVGDTRNTLDDDTFAKLGRLADGASGSDIKDLVQKALMEPVRRCRDAEQFILDEKKEHWLPSKTCKCGAKWIGMEDEDFPLKMLREPDLCEEDFERALLRWSKSVDQKSLIKFSDFTKSFGVHGN
ncbi:hypothetical protein ACHAXR_004707 [Thalassiosira sp. AJA248-18]